MKASDVLRERAQWPPLGRLYLTNDCERALDARLRTADAVLKDEHPKYLDGSCERPKCQVCAYLSAREKER